MLENLFYCMQILLDSSSFPDQSASFVDFHTTLEFPLVKTDTTINRVELDGPNLAGGQVGVVVKMAPTYGSGF